MIEQLGDFKLELKKFIDSSKTAGDYLRLLTTYEKARNHNVKVSDITSVLEEMTKTEIPDDDFD